MLSLSGADDPPPATSVYNPAKVAALTAAAFASINEWVCRPTRNCCIGWPSGLVTKLKNRFGIGLT